MQTPSSQAFAKQRLLRSLALLALLQPLTHQAWAAAGRTPGSFAVSPMGSATYSISIFAPRGPKGLQPNIALSYDSHQANDYVGVGWKVSGLSSIYRCNYTYAQDGSPMPVTLHTADGLCLDGKRLRLTGGTYGKTGSTYQTEIADFSFVTASGTAGNGPASFTVQTRDGFTYEYGNGGGSLVLAAGSSSAVMWMVDKITDNGGNTMTFSYTSANGTTVPNVISWTPVAPGSSSYSYTMTFAYTAISANLSKQGYVAGTRYQNLNLLQTISVQYNTTLVKEYFLGYQNSATTGRYRLNSVKECADSAQSNCLPPTTMTYQDGSEGVASAVTVATPTQAPRTSGQSIAYDFNGDGHNDLVWADPASGNWFVAFGGNSGFASPINTGIPASGVINDGDGSGEDGFLVPEGGNWIYYKWNGSSFVSSTVASSSADKTTAGTYTFADVDGDGLPDLITTTASDNYLYVRLNTFGSTGTVGFATGTKTISNAYTKVVSGLGAGRHLDSTGSGRDDLLAQTASNLYVLHFDGTTLNPNSIGVASAIDVGDYNDDGCTDILAVQTLYLAACNGTAAQAIALPANAVGAVDWDGDGRRDLLVQNGSTLGVYLSTGTGFSSTMTATSVPYASSLSFWGIANATGDGSEGVVSLSSTSPYNIQFFAHTAGATKPDLLTNVTDGYGNAESPTYVTVAQSLNGTYFASNDQTYPYQNYLGPMYVVNQVTYSDPTLSAPTYQIFSFYSGAAWNLQGRGFSGFATTQIWDRRSGGDLWRTWGYGRDFPYTGMYEAEVATQNNTSATNLWSVSSTQNVTTLSSTPYQQRYFPYLSNLTRQDYEIASGTNPLVKSTSTNFTFDTYGNATQVTSTVTDKDTNSPFYSDSWTTTVNNTPSVDGLHWCLTLLSQSQVSYSAMGVSDASVTRTQTFTPDNTHCRYSQIVTEPTANSGLYKVTENLGYDSFGNVNSDSMVGANMPNSPATRTTTVNWGTTGQFPMSVTDPSNATTLMNYNFYFGQLSSFTDPNGVTTSWTYGDGFGRRTKETRADNTYTMWTYNDCTTNGGCLLTQHSLAVAQTVYNSDGSTQTSGTTYDDALERPIMANNQALAAGTYTRSEIRYDARGRQTQQAFPCTWSSVATICPHWQTTTYDILNRATLVQRPITSTNSTLQSTSYTYQGRTLTVTDPYNVATTFVNDVNGRRRKVTDANAYTVSFGLDAAGSQTQVTDSLGNNLWAGTVVYGVNAFLTGESDMDRGANWTYTVDSLGERIGWKDAKTQSFSAYYDALSRMTQRKEPDYYTQWTWGATPASYNVGKLQSVCTGTGSSPSACDATDYSESKTYDNVSRLATRAITIPGLPTFTYGYAYNATSGLLDTLTYPVSTNGKSLALKYAYSSGFLQSITDTLDNVTVWAINTMNPARQRTQETLGNGIVIASNYDAVTGWPSYMQAGVGGGTGVQNLNFLFDEVGNLIQRQDQNHTLTESLYYDSVYRLKSSTLNGNSNLSLNYDQTGNITQRSDVANNATWTYDPVKKHAVKQAGSTSFQYAYDANGNMTSRQGATIGWSAANYPISLSSGTGSTAESMTLAYGPDRQRWQMMYTGAGITETTSYVGGLLEVVYSNGIYDYRHYIYAGSKAVAVASRKSSDPSGSSSTISYLLSDHESSVASITDKNGTPIVAESFTPYGLRRNPTTWSGSASTGDLTASAGITRQGYTFQTGLGIYSGLNHMNGRVEDAITGRFLSPNPQVPYPTNTQSYNHYGYALNNPLTYRDPTGFDDTCPDPGGTTNPGSGTPTDPTTDPGNGTPTDPTTDPGTDPGSGDPGVGGGDIGGGGGGGDITVQPDSARRSVKAVGSGCGGAGTPNAGPPATNPAPGVTCDANGGNCTVNVCGNCTAQPPLMVPSYTIPVTTWNPPLLYPGQGPDVNPAKPQRNPKPSFNPLKNSRLCQVLQSSAASNVALTGDLAGAVGVGGALHVSVSPDSINVFIGGGIGGGGEVGVTVGPAFEHNTSSVFGIRTFATFGAGGGFGGSTTVTAGSNGVSVSGGFGTVEGALAETGYGLDINIPVSLADLLCN